MQVAMQATTQTSLRPVDRRARAALAAFAVLTAGVSGCSSDKSSSPPDNGKPPDGGKPPPADCRADAPAFVREVALALLGRRPSSQHEVDAYVALYQQVEAASKAGASTAKPREVVARAMLARPEKLARWTTHVMDALRVTRIEDQSQVACWGQAMRDKVDPALAIYVRDNAATAPGSGEFSMLDLARSAIAADDPTPVYRAHLFPLVNRPFAGANASRLELELARREEYGSIFDGAYLNRDIVCLGCHNSESSVTFTPDPATNRHWPLAGHLDAAVFGASDGMAPARAHAMFRYDGFANQGDDEGAAGQPRVTKRPWGMVGCGEFTDPATLTDDPAGIDGSFATMRGKRLTVFDLDGALRHGFDRLRGGAIAVGGGGAIADPEAALAYMVATSIVEGVWRETVGTRLTIANYFPRNQASRDMLQRLTDGFVKHKFSLDALLVDIVTSEYFARKPPEASCGESPYAYPAIYDPWTFDDGDAARRGNGPGDAVAPVSARALLSAAYAGLEWPAPGEEPFPVDETDCADLTCPELKSSCADNVCCATYHAKCDGGAPVGSSDELSFQRSIGVFLKNGERGFRGLDFQARLGWEDRFGACRKPAWVTGDDFIARAVAAGRAAPGATTGNVIALIKDRLIGEPQIDPGAETAALEAVTGAPLSSPAASLGEAAARRVCGVVMSSPQFVLQGMAARGGAAPSVTLAGDGFDDACAKIASAAIPGWRVTCAAGTLTAAPQAAGTAAPPVVAPAMVAPLTSVRRTPVRRAPAARLPVDRQAVRR